MRPVAGAGKGAAPSRALVGFVLLLTVANIGGWVWLHREVDAEAATRKAELAATVKRLESQHLAAIRRRQDDIAGQAEAAGAQVAGAQARVEAVAGQLAALSSRIDNQLRHSDDTTHAQLERAAATVRRLSENVTHAWQLIDGLIANASAVGGSGQAGGGGSTMAELNGELSSMAFALSQVWRSVAAGKVPLDVSGRKINPLSVVRRLRDCDLNCSGHGLSLDLPGITDGCECHCTADWHGPLCEREPASWRLYASHPAPPLVIPMHREEVPPLNESAEGCKAAAKEYYLQRYKTEEFRTDRALKFFWGLVRGSFQPRCSSVKDGQAIIVDIGANVGEQLAEWEAEFLNLTHCGEGSSNQDTLLLLVEPNPANLAVLRKRVRDMNDRIAAAAAEAAENGAKAPVRSGKAVVVESAASFYNGVGSFAINKKQARKEAGNERGSLDVKSAVGSDPTTALVETRVETVGAMIRRMSPGLVRERGNWTLSLLKIDAEGYDPAILYGAHDVLRKTNVIVFECHKLWKNAGFTFRDVAEYLARAGFKTFKMGLFYYIPVTPPAYWDDVYDETLQWSNCLAVREGFPFERQFMLPPPCGHDEARH